VRAFRDALDGRARIASPIARFIFFRRSESVTLRALVLSAIAVAAPAAASAAPTPNVVTEWAGIVQQAIHNASAPRSAGTSQILHTMVHLAVYDAVVAIEGGYKPYAARIAAPKGADVRAAVATAAWLTARPRIVAANLAAFDQAYTAYMANLPLSPAVTDGIAVGTQAAEAILALRANDRFSAVVPYECSATPPAIGEFLPDTGCPTGPASAQPADAKVGGIQPFTVPDIAVFRADGPPPMASETYATDFAETRDYGRAEGSLRTPEETDVAWFWAENPYVHWNRNLIALAIAHEESVRGTARLFAMVHTSVSDAIIAGFAAKYQFRFWRPRTAIPLADFDGNDATVGDATWRPLLSVNHPEYPSGHGFWSTALISAVSGHYGTTRVSWTIATSKAAVPALVKTERTYKDLLVLLQEIGDARVWAGLHWRQSIRDGAKIGARVSAHVQATQFRKMK
jgi:hypothetical protein